MDRDRFSIWRAEHKLAADLAAKVEATERGILQQIGCPTDPVQVFAIVNGQVPPPWPKHTAPRDQRRALHAMQVLVLLQQVRRHIGNPDSENARLAAHDALMAGLFSNDAATHIPLALKVRQQRSKAGRHRGEGRRDVHQTWITAARSIQKLRPELSGMALARAVRQRLGIQQSINTIRQRLQGHIKKPLK